MSLLEIRERYWDNPMGAPDAPSAWMVKAFAAIARPVWNVVFRFKVIGEENLAEIDASGKGAIVSANHVSLCDPPTLFLALRPRSLRCMGKEQIFTNATQLVAQVGSAMGAFPVKRDTADRKAIKRAVSFIEAGEYVGIFPEGTRMRLPSMKPQCHAGTVLVARMARAPIVPVGIDGTQNICPNGSHFPRYFTRVTVRIGRPIDPAGYEHVDKHIRNDVVLNDVMRNIYALRDDCHVDMIPQDVIGLAERVAKATRK